MASSEEPAPLLKRREVPDRNTVLEVARQLGAVSFTPPPMRAVRGVSFTFDQLDRFVMKMINPNTLIVDVSEGCAKLAAADDAVSK